MMKIMTKFNKQNKKMALSLSMLVLAVASLLSTSAFADTITLNLSNSVQTASAGSTLSFDATVNASNANLGTVFLNGDSLTLDSPLSLDDTGFLTNFPLSLDAGDFFSGLLFTISLPPETAAGLYTGSFVILGGADASAQDILATVNFNVNVPEASQVSKEDILSNRYCVINYIRVRFID